VTILILVAPYLKVASVLDLNHAIEYLWLIPAVEPLI